MQINKSNAGFFLGQAISQGFNQGMQLAMKRKERIETQGVTYDELVKSIETSKTEQDSLAGSQFDNQLTPEDEAETNNQEPQKKSLMKPSILFDTSATTQRQPLSVGPVAQKAEPLFSTEQYMKKEQPIEQAQAQPEMTKYQKAKQELKEEYSQLEQQRVEGLAKTQENLGNWKNEAIQFIDEASKPLFENIYKGKEEIRQQLAVLAVQAKKGDFVPRDAYNLLTTRLERLNLQEAEAKKDIFKQKQDISERAFTNALQIAIKENNMPLANKLLSEWGLISRQEISTEGKALEQQRRQGQFDRLMEFRERQQAFSEKIQTAKLSMAKNKAVLDKVTSTGFKEAEELNGDLSSTLEAYDTIKRDATTFTGLPGKIKAIMSKNPALASGKVAFDAAYNALSDEEKAQIGFTAQEEQFLSNLSMMSAKFRQGVYGATLSTNEQSDAQNWIPTIGTSFEKFEASFNSITNKIIRDYGRRVDDLINYDKGAATKILGSRVEKLNETKKSLMKKEQGKQQEGYVYQGVFKPASSFTKEQIKFLEANGIKKVVR